MHARSEIDSVPFGETLRHFRLVVGLTQEELADQAGVSRLTISSLERGVRRVPHKDTVRRLADALQLPARDRARLEAAGRRKSPGAPGNARGIIPPARSATSPPLVGRGRQVEVLERHVEGAGPSLVMLAGEPGIGKTRLLDESAAYAALYGFRIIRGGCERRGIQEQYSPVSTALAQHLFAQTSEQRRGVVRSFPWLARLLPEVSTDLLEDLPLVPPEHEIRLVSQAVADYVISPGADHSANTMGTLLVLDDLQWAGEDALELLSALVRRVNGSAANYIPLRIVGAYRDTEVSLEDPLSTTLADLVPGRLATQLSVEPLSTEESRQLLGALLIDHHGHDIDAALRSAGGVPFFLIEYAQSIHAGENGVPLDVSQSIRSRVAALTDESREILRVAASVGSTAPLGVVMAATGQGVDVFVRGLDAVQRAKLLVIDGEDQCRFPNDVFREVIERDLVGALRESLRQRIEAAHTSSGIQMRESVVAAISRQSRRGP